MHCRVYGGNLTSKFSSYKQHFVFNVGSLKIDVAMEMVSSSAKLHVVNDKALSKKVHKHSDMYSLKVVICKWDASTTRLCTATLN